MTRKLIIFTLTHVRMPLLTLIRVCVAFCGCIVLVICIVSMNLYITVKQYDKNSGEHKKNRNLIINNFD